MSDQHASGSPVDPEPVEPIELIDPDADGPVPDVADEPETFTVEELVATLESVTAERDQHLDDLQRVSAEFANFRRQTEKRNAEFAQQASARLVEVLLPVLDSVEAAVQQGVDGIEPIAAQLRSVLEREGLEIIVDEAEPFDPTRHEAAISEPAEEGDADPDGVSVVVQILRTGYAWNGRVLRAAMVKVKG